VWRNVYNSERVEGKKWFHTAGGFAYVRLHRVEVFDEQR